MSETSALPAKSGKAGWLGISKKVWIWIGGISLGIIILLIYYFMVYIPAQKEKEIANQIARIRADAGWLAVEQQKATDWGKTLDEVLRIDAIWLLSQNSPGGYDYTDYV